MPLWYSEKDIQPAFGDYLGLLFSFPTVHELLWCMKLHSFLPNICPTFSLMVKADMFVVIIHVGCLDCYVNERSLTYLLLRVKPKWQAKVMTAGKYTQMCWEKKRKARRGRYKEMTFTAEHCSYCIIF